MAWTVSYLPPATIRDSLKNVIALNLSDATAGAYKVALFNNSVVTGTTEIDTDPQSYNVAPWNANEVTGTNWAAGGVALATASPALTKVSAVGVMWDATDISVVSTTLTNAFGCLIYADLLTPKAAVAAVWFGGTGYSTSNGTFGITWDALGIFRIDTTP
jgi:VanZ family protein